MSLLKMTSFTLLIVFIAIQVIRPAHNISGQLIPADITKQFGIPASVQGILNTSCYDCHSNNTQYPWYANIQPIGWLLANHIKDGKAALNFNEFADYSKRRQISKLKAVNNSIKDKTMPLSSYTLLHPDAKLSEESRALIIEWTTRSRDSLETKN